MGNKILIIEDNDQDQKIIKRYLKKAGYEDVLLADNGEDGVAKAQSEQPDLVISDTNLPGINGFEVCRQIRETVGKEAPQIIIMTGAIDAVDAVKARQMGANDYCVKTSDCQPLMEAVKQLLQSA